MAFELLLIRNVHNIGSIEMDIAYDQKLRGYNCHQFSHKHTHSFNYVDIDNN